MNNFLNPQHKKAFFDDTDKIIAGFKNDFRLLKSSKDKKEEKDKKELLTNIHRYAHNCKGLFAMMGLEEVEQISDKLESVLGQILKDGVFELGKDALKKIENGFNKIEELLNCIKDDSKSFPAS